MVKKNSTFDLMQLTETLGCDPHIATMVEIRKRMAAFGANKKKQLVSMCEKALKSNQISLNRNTKNRIAAIKIVVAAVPLTALTIEALVSHEYKRHNLEIMFTLFCFLDHLHSIPKTKALRKRILIRLESFLLNIKRNTAHAAWKAGELLGGHWSLKESLPVLLRIATSARYSAGREASVDGLGEALKSGEMSEFERKRVVALLESISVGDKSQNVRTAAILNLKMFKRV